MLDALRILFAFLSLWAIFKGGLPEKAGAVIVMLSFVGGILLRAAGYPLDFIEPSIAHLALIGVFIPVSMMLAVQANRLWPLLFAALVLVEFFGHLSYVIIQTGYGRAYWALTQIPTILQILTFSAGTWMHVRRRKRGVRAPDWRFR